MYLRSEFSEGTVDSDIIKQMYRRREIMFRICKNI